MTKMSNLGLPGLAWNEFKQTINRLTRDINLNLPASRITY